MSTQKICDFAPLDLLEKVKPKIYLLEKVKPKIYLLEKVKPKIYLLEKGQTKNLPFRKR